MPRKVLCLLAKALLVTNIKESTSDRNIIKNVYGSTLNFLSDVQYYVLEDYKVSEYLLARWKSIPDRL